ncbi:MAG: metal ABC transporter permease [Chlamydiales bacterium]|jgi:zinc transport system permease protein|nr:metal ABC transporter permease [Chlamydiales bacterium]
MFDHLFLLHTLLAGCGAALTGGIIGSYVVVKRIVSISGSIAHSVLGGMGICLWLKIRFGLTLLTPFIGAFLAGIISAFLMGWIHLKYKEREDTAIAAIWAIGMSIGVIFIALTPGYNTELIDFLFGNILWISNNDIFLLFILNAFILSIVARFYKPLLAICFDEELAKLKKLPVQTFYFLLLSLVATSIVLLIQIVGAILVVTMLAIPAAIAAIFTRSLLQMMTLATACGLMLTLIGTLLSYQLNWPPGATISLVSSSCYAGALFFKKKA